MTLTINKCVHNYFENIYYNENLIWIYFKKLPVQEQKKTNWEFFHSLPTWDCLNEFENTPFVYTFMLKCVMGSLSDL